VCGKEEITAAGIPAPDRTAVQPPGRVESLPRPEKRVTEEERVTKN
jgi:hypothetical protein